MPGPLFQETPARVEFRLPVGDGHTLLVEECGRPDGVPVLFLHGGPGSGCSPAHRRLFDPARFRAVLFDQRGCGRSTPLGGLRANTTAHLVADMELIRNATGIDRWIVFGGSWGTLLALAYAQQHPERVMGLVLRGVFLGSAEERRRYVEGADGSAPEAWRRFAAGVPAAERADLLAAYASRLLSEDFDVHQAAARCWLDYERALMGEPPLAAPPEARLLAKARLQAHYLTHGCFADPASLLAGCERIRHLPGAIVQGTRDPVCPPRAAEALCRAWPEAEWVGVEGGAHGAFAPGIAAASIGALDRVARRAAP